jgi:lysozyme
MKTNAAGLALIEQFEGDKLQAYQDGNGIWTIGYGHVGAHKGEYETQAQAEADLCADLGTAEAAVTRLVQVPLNENQFSALVSFVYNEGSGRLQSSTLLKCLNAGSYSLAAQQFLVWDIIAGQVSEGLERRRFAEMTLFLEPVT